MIQKISFHYIDEKTFPFVTNEEVFVFSSTNVSYVSSFLLHEENLSPEEILYWKKHPFPEAKWKVFFQDATSKQYSERIFHLFAYYRQSFLKTSYEKDPNQSLTITLTMEDEQEEVYVLPFSEVWRMSAALDLWKLFIPPIEKTPACLRYVIL